MNPLLEAIQALGEIIAIWKARALEAERKLAELEKKP